MKNKSLHSLLVPSANRQSCALFAIALSALLASQSAFADDANWTGGSLTDANWTNTGNWSATPVPGTGNTATFNAAIANTWGNAAGNPVVIDDVAGQSIKSITFTAAAGSYFIGSTGGNKLKLEDAGTFNITNALTNLASAVVTETINAPLELQGTAYTFINNSPNGTAAKAGILNIGGAISGVNAAATVLTLTGTSTNANTVSGTVSNGTAPSLGIIKVGSGTWVLSGANTFSGPVSVQQGILSVNSIADSGTSALGFGALNLGNLTTGGTLTYTADAPATTSRAITLTGSTGGATINTPAFGTTLDTSTLTFSGTFTTGIGGNKLVTFAGGNAGANTVSSLLANATDGSTLTVVKSGSGTWTLTNPNNSFTGPLFLNQGFLTVNSIADGGAPCNIGAGTSIRFGNAASIGFLRYTGGAQSTNRTVQLGNNSATPVATDTGGATIQNDGSGALVFSATPAFNTPLNTASGVSANRVLTLRGTNADANTISGAIQDNIITGTATGTATVGVTKTEAGNWTIAGANTYSGPTIVAGGTLTISGSRSVTAGAITMNTAVTAVLNLQATGTYTTGIITIGSGGSTSTLNQSAGTITSPGGSGLIMGNGAVTTTSTYALSGGSLTASIIMGTNLSTGTPHLTNFNLSGTGTLTSTTLRIGRYDAVGSLNSDNTFAQTGGTATITNFGLGGNTTDAASTNPIVAKLNLTGGTFSATNFASLSAGGANTSTITIGGSAQATLPAFPTGRGTGSTATLTFDGGTLIPAATSATYLSGLTNAFITANGAKIDVPATRDITIAQVLENAPSAVGSLTKSGLGALVLSGTNTYTGNTTVVDGTLEISSTYLADSSTLTIGTAVASPAVLNLPNAGTDTVAALVIDGVAQANGLYDSTNSGGAITGPGKIQVGASANTYANWLAANAPATGFSTDTDNDGVPNGVENVLGTNPNTSSAGLTQVSATANSVTFQHTLNPTIASDVSYSYQWSTDLTEWKASGVANTAGTIGTIAPSAPVSGVVTVVTTQSGTASSKLFTRIKAGNP